MGPATTQPCSDLVGLWQVGEGCPVVTCGSGLVPCSSPTLAVPWHQDGLVGITWG